MSFVRFDDKRVLLTGALGTLGRAQALAFAASGARLLLLDLPDDERAAELMEAVDRIAAGCGEYVGQDLSDLDASQRRIAVIAQQGAGIDVLVNNAALIENKPFEDFTLSQYEAQMRVNAGAAFALAQAVAPGMRERGRGAIINLCSVTLNGRWNGYVPYVASKGAMMGLTRALARELGSDGIRVNGVSPGAVVSEAEARVFGNKAAEYASWVLENQSLKERIVGADIADAVLYLASDRARMVNGHILDVTAGW